MTLAPSTGINWTDPAIAKIRRDMLRFAQLQLRDAAAAEDMVQEALLSAVKYESSFAGRSALKTWMFSILRNKIVDHLRSRGPELPFADLLREDAEGDDDFDAFFNERGHWNAEDRPPVWADPEASLSQTQFWAVFEACLERLPEATSRVFMMREFLDLETGEICQQLGISTSNCWVILHRARSGLRLCLDHRWFGKEPE